MRKEDLFDAMQGIDDDLIARSERRPAKRHVFRNFVIIAAAAACLALLLMNNGILVGGSFMRSGSSNDDTAYSESDAESAAEVDSADSETASSDTMDSANSEAEAASEETGDTGAGGDSASGDDISEDSAGSGSVGGESGDDSADTDGKTSADLLGSLKGDYVKVEYASAGGGSRKEAVYSDSGAAALSSALSGGSPTLKIFVRTGDPIYYVYLVKSDGSEDTVTFYENDYVSISTYRGVVMEVSDSDYQAVLTLFQ